MMNNKKKLIGILSLITALMIAVGSVFMAAAENKTPATVKEASTVCTSPFTEAVQKVHDSVVGVNNYITYRQNRNNGYNYSPFGGFYGWGNGWGNGYGNGWGNDYGYDNGNSSEEESRQVLYGTGSGVVVATGYVLTNYHVIENASSLEITTEAATYPATLVVSDASVDLAVLYAPDLDLEPVVLGDSDTINVGDWAICIGNPLSFTGTTTVGIISALNRQVSGDSTDAYGKKVTNTMIQTDAAINSGNSGGGMFNTAGELIGIPSLKYTSSSYSSVDVDGIGMAIPVNIAKPLIYAAVNGEVPATAGNDNNTDTTLTNTPKPRIGVTVTNMNANNYAVSNGLIPTGAYVVSVEENSPAAEAGLMEGDIIVEINGEIVKSSSEMVALLQKMNVNDQVSIKLYRVEGGLNNVESYTNFPDGEYITVTATLKIIDNDQEVQQ